MTADDRPAPTVAEMLRANEANWDARAPVHVRSDFYGLDGSRAPGDWFAPFEWEDLGDLHGRDVLHLMCHLGTETLAFAERGAARTVGLDFSAASLAGARRIAAEAGREVEFVRADVHRAPEALDGRRFDVVYTGKGALCYLPDLAAWAEVVRTLLRPGGVLYLVEFHPLLDSLGPAGSPDGVPELLLRHDYLAGRGPVRKDSPHTYTDGPPLAGATTGYEWRHGLGDVVTALAGAGLAVDLLRETDLLPWPRFAAMERDPASGWWRLPATRPAVPLIFALRAAAAPGPVRGS
ncbi:class I SAM-dependent methyltransferase [Streptomyces aculeolatus]|uniref:class I SAM-dependent methyltransferase n=1 Tax=Streptomyces aculeolatus TaxID=270689 RepID=UPI001CEC0A3C|nr:class I SAM-dependent methyltransferase [Streptomyces aculeolatus]